jgi:hypothetical protein
MTECPRCASPAPHLHPAMQSEGEVEVCSDNFHKRVTAINTPERILEATGGPYIVGMTDGTNHTDVVVHGRRPQNRT